MILYEYIKIKNFLYQNIEFNVFSDISHAHKL